MVKMRRKNIICLVLSCILVLAGIVLLGFAIHYQQRVVEQEEFLSTMVNKSVPRRFYELVASTRRRIPLFTSLGIILCVAGAFLLFFPRKTIFPIVLLAIILFAGLPINVYGMTPEPEKWWAELTLQQPRDAVGIGGDIYVYDNNLSSINSNAFVAFRILVARVDVIYDRMEWLEVGYFENQSGFWIYGVTLIEETYSENDVTGLSGEGSNGEGYLRFTIGETESNKFVALMYDVPGPGIWYIIDGTFTIGGDNLYEAGSESNDDFNSLVCHYANLHYSDEETSYFWQDVEAFADYPYHVNMVSTKEFFTYGGYIRVGKRSGGYITVQDECKL